MTQNLRPDAAGQVKVFDLEAREWIDRFAIDAREMVASGAVSLQGPRIRVKKGKKTETVCSEELREKLSDGWKRVEVEEDSDSEAPQPDETSGVPEPSKKPKRSRGTRGKGKSAESDEESTDAAPPTPIDFHAIDEEQLRIWVASQRVEGAGEMTKSELIEVLERINFEPPAE